MTKKLSQKSGVVSANREDLREVVALNKLLSLPIKDFCWDKTWWIRDEIEAGNYFVMRDRKGIAAAMCFHKENKEGVIETLAVRPDLHGKGIGKAMVANAQEMCRAEDIKKLSVGSLREYNAKSFYEGCGFTCDPKLPSFRGHKYYWFTMKL